MDTDRADELRMLRERAYGRSADIHSDPAAVRRLAQLESEGVPAEPVIDAAADAVATEPPSSPGTSRAAGATGHRATSAPAFPERVRRRARLRIAALWAGSVLAAVAMTVVIVAAVLQGRVVQVDSTVGAAQEAVLPLEDAELALPAEFGPADDARAYAEFQGMTPLTYVSRQSGDVCVLVMPSDGVTDFTADIYQGEFFIGCAVGSFPAAVAFRVTETSSAQLRDAFPEGTALRFALDAGGEAVVVFSSATGD